MKPLKSIALSALLLFSAGSAAASPEGEALKKCFSDQTTGRDHAVFIRMIFIAIAQHPDLQGLANISDQQKAQAADQTGAMLARLMGHDCRKEVEAAYKADGASAFTAGGEYLGRVSMSGLMTDPAVLTYLSSLDAHMPPDYVNWLKTLQR